MRGISLEHSIIPFEFELSHAHGLSKIALAEVVTCVEGLQSFSLMLQILKTRGVMNDLLGRDLQLGLV